MDLSYLITPFLAWFITGCTKFAINSIKSRRLAFDLVGYGGMPSNHSAIVSSAAAIVAFKEGISSPALVVALALVFIVVLDATSLRQQIGKHSKTINVLTQNTDTPPLRERMGHTRLEVLVGVISGVAAAAIADVFFSRL